MDEARDVYSAIRKDGRPEGTSWIRLRLVVVLFLSFSFLLFAYMHL